MNLDSGIPPGEFFADQAGGKLVLDSETADFGRKVVVEETKGVRLLDQFIQFLVRDFLILMIIETDLGRNTLSWNLLRIAIYFAFQSRLRSIQKIRLPFTNLFLVGLWIWTK